MALGHLHIRNQQGILGETAAQNVLINKGYTLLETNWKMGHLEVDIIASNATDIVFVEVKARNSDAIRRPEEWVDKTKKRHMQAAANGYIKLNHIQLRPRFDIIGVLLNQQGDEIKEIMHLEDAFQPRIHTIHSGYTSEHRWHKKGFWTKR